MISAPSSRCDDTFSEMDRNCDLSKIQKEKDQEKCKDGHMANDTQMHKRDLESTGKKSSYILRSLASVERSLLAS